MILLYSSFLKGEEAKITVTPGELSAEGTHSAIGKINHCIDSSKIGTQMPYFMHTSKRSVEERGHNDTLEERISG